MLRFRHGRMRIQRLRQAKVLLKMTQSFMETPWFEKFGKFAARTPDELISNLEAVGMKVRDASFCKYTEFHYRYTYIALSGMRMTSVIGSPFSIEAEGNDRWILSLASQAETFQSVAGQLLSVPAGTISCIALEDLRANSTGGLRLRTYFSLVELEDRMKRWTGGRIFDVDHRSRLFTEDWRGPMLRSAMVNAAALLSAIPDGSMRTASFLNADESLLRTVALCLSDGFLAYCQSPSRQASSKQVRRADDFIAAHASEPLRVAAIAEAAGISERSLQLSFKRELGCSPMERVRERRLTLAFDALREAPPTTTVAAIAANFGFRNAGDFSVLFRQKFGRLPSEVLKQGAISPADAHFRM